jgi:CRISPR-associated endonuclease Cas2
MSAFVVTYDLHQPGQKHKQLTEHLESYPTHWHLQRSVWVIVTNQKAKELADSLLQFLDSNDKLLVLRLSGDAAWWGYDEETSGWLRSIL